MKDNRTPQYPSKDIITEFLINKLLIPHKTVTNTTFHRVHCPGGKNPK